MSYLVGVLFILISISSRKVYGIRTSIHRSKSRPSEVAEEEKGKNEEIIPIDLRET